MTETERAIYEAARELKNSRFNIIPSVLFENDHRVRDGEYDEVLRLVAGGRPVCPECGEEVDVEDDDDGEQTWVCGSCDASSSIGVDVDELQREGSQLAWPCAHAYMFWTEDFGSSIVEAAEQAGFLVFEHCDLGGVLLGIDGGGYDFVDAHWVKLYTALGLEWHRKEA